MIEHAVPQNVTSYQFHLIGNMTIKQFLMILAGIGLAGLVYSTNLAAILKWPIILVFVGAGAALAFVPYEERSLDQWLINFVRAMYRPTKFFWRRMGTPPELFAFTPRTDSQTSQARPTISRGVRQSRVNSYLSTLGTAPAATQADDPLDLLGKNMSDLDALFANTPAAKNIAPGEDLAVKPHLQVRARPLKDHGAVAPAVSAAPTAVIPAPLPQPMMTMELPEEPFVPAEPQFTHSPAVVEAVQTVSVEPVLTALPAAEAIQPDATVAENFSDSTLSESTLATPATPTVTAPELSSTTPVVFNRSLPFPSLPDQPNMLLGMVYDASGASLANAILEILNQQGNTVRALKTNPLGQFYTSTPLAAGEYRIEIEHEGHTFPVFALPINNTILDPIEIRATT